MVQTRACPNVLAHGTCTDPSCTHEHNVYDCELCTMVFDNREDYDAHLASRQHVNRARGEPGIFVLCTLCSKYICGMGSWNAHIRSNRHISRATRQGIAPNSINPEVPEAVPGHQLCVICTRHIANGHWTRHINTPAHKNREQFVSYSSALEEAEKDKNGVSVAGDFDFKIVDPAAASNGVKLSATIQTDVPTSRVALIEFKLASSTGRQTSSPFAVSVEGASRIISYRSALRLSMTMRQAYLGRSVDRLELIFEDLQLKKRFMIARTLQVIVGSKEDHDALKPRSPYVPRKRTTRQQENDIVEGEFPPSTKAIPYVDRLPRALMPRHLATTLETGTRNEILGRLKSLYLPKVVNSETYSKHFKHLLWTEEFQMDRDLEYYDIPNAQLKKYNSYYYLDVPGLAEKRPSVLVGDRILVHRHGSSEGHWFEGGVHVVRKEEVGLKYHRSFVASTSDQFLVRFKLNRYPMRRQHQAMDYVFSQDRVLFPAGTHVPANYPRATTSGMKLRNQLIGTNVPQLQAVVSIARQAPGSVPFVIFGPPGTGKTVTMVEAIFQVLDSNPTARVLACAPSNSAADLITSRLKSLSTDQLFRAYAPSRSKEQVPTDVLPYTYQNRDGHFSVPLLARMKRFRVVVTTCVSANIVSGIGITRGHYSHIFIDEAGQATEPEAMISIKTMADNNTNIILSGDPKQLGPIIRSGIARELGLETSYIERLMKREIYDEVSGYGKSVVKLVKNFRSHNAILKFPNERFYRGDLQPCGDSKVINSYLDSQHVISKKFPIVFHAISGKDDREASSPSFFNIDEVTLVKSLIAKLRSDRKIRITDNDIGVIAPYHAQVLKLRNALRSVADAVKVGSVEEFQGQERRVIIISTVRSSREFVEYDLKHTLGFVANPRRFNVAVTRAQALLIIVGDPSVLSLDPLWRSFLNYIHGNGGWTGQPPTWDTSAAVEETGGYDSAVREAAREDMNEFTRMMESLTLHGVEAAVDEDGDAANVDRPWNEME